MLSNPPPTSAEVSHFFETLTAINPNESQHILNHSVYDAGLGSVGTSERSDMEDRSEFHDASDEDQDMSEGGAALTMTLSHAEQLNAEMDILDAEVMGHDNLVGLYLDTQYSSVEDHDGYGDVLSEEYHAQHPTQSEGATQNIFQPTLGSAVSLPAAMSEVSQQLQYIQDGQQHAESVDALDEPHGTFINNSTPSILLSSLATTQAQSINAGSGPYMDFVSPAEMYSAQNIQPSAGFTTAPHLWSIEGSTPSPALDVLVSSQNQPSNPHNISLDVNIMDDSSEADFTEVEDQFNLSLGDFLYEWATSPHEESRRRFRGPSLTALHEHRLEKLRPVQRSDLRGERCDIQRINWNNLGVTRAEARDRRRRTYKNYTNLRLKHQLLPRQKGLRASDNQNFFRFNRMDFDHEVHLSHFQLRNLMACASQDHLFYAGKSKVMQWNPRGGTAATQAAVAMDLTDPDVQPFHTFSGGIQISTLTVGHDILVAGGFCGEYGLVNLRAEKSAKHTEGLITDHVNSITNHVQVHLSRTSSSPLAAFASNDNEMRILDISTNKFIAEHKYEHAINSTAISPDQRLRVLVGDTRNVMICHSETGEILQSLDGHRDFGFACDWADDGWTVATGNQDMQVKIWDARKWTNSSGFGQPIATVAAEMAGVRKLKFSPLGSGKRVLLAAEPADIISVIDGNNFASKQQLSFFGEIGGVDFTNDGQDLIVANCDNMRGGLMQYERCGYASEGLHNLEEFRNASHGAGHIRRRNEGYDWMSRDEDLMYHPKSRGTDAQRQRKAALLGVTMGHF